MNKRNRILVLLTFVAALAATGFAQMHGGQGGGMGVNTGVGTGNGMMGNGTGNGVMGEMGVMLGHDLTIGPDGTAYVLDPDFTVSTAPKTSVIAISPKSAKPSEWKSTVAGIVHEVAAGADKVVVSASTQGMMGAGFGPGNQGMHGQPPTTTTLVPLKSKLYFLNSADGVVVRTIDHDGIATSLTVRKIDTVEYLYLVTRDHAATTGTGSVPGPKVKLSIYRMDGTTVKSVNLTSDEIVEMEM